MAELQPPEVRDGRLMTPGRQPSLIVGDVSGACRLTPYEDVFEGGGAGKGEQLD